MMGTPAHRYLSRGSGNPLPSDDLLLTLVPPNTYVPFEHVYRELLAVRQEQALDWVGTTPDTWCWAILSAKGVGVSIEVKNAIQRHVLVCLSSQPEPPVRRSWLAALRATIGRLLGFRSRPAQAAPAEGEQSPRVEREAAAILAAHRF